MEPLGITAQTLYCQNLEPLRYIVVADSIHVVLIIFIQIFVVGSEKRTSFDQECIMALQGHPRLLILTPIESGYATSYRSSIVTLVLSCPVSEILQVSGQHGPTSIPPEF